MNNYKEPLNSSNLSTKNRLEDNYSDSKVLKLNNSYNINQENISNNSNAIYNQTSDILVVNNSKIFKTSSVKAICPNCRIKCNTNVSNNINKLNLSFSIFCTIPWLIIQKIKKKEYNCKDANHTCPSCSGFVGNYSAC